MIQPEQLHTRILEELDLSRDVEDEELMELILRVLEEQEYIPIYEKALLGRELFNAFRKLDVLQELLEDEDITEVMINGTQNIFVEKKGALFLSDRRFTSREKLEDVIQQIAAGSNRLVNEASPILDARLEDGSRVNVVLHPAAVDGPAVTIRKFPRDRITMEKLQQINTISAEVAKVLQTLVAARYNIFISGGTGTGKTTFLNALSQFIPKDERVIVIEDNAELQIQDVANLVRLEARTANIEGQGAITIRDLIRAALRMRPDRIIVGEVRGAETIDMVQAMSTGHNGSLSTGHSNSPKDMVSRLETMILMGMEIPLAAVQRQLASGIDIIVHLGRLRDKSRKVLEVAEVLGWDADGVRLRTLYEFRETGVNEEVIQGEWIKVHEITKKGKLFSAGYREEAVCGGKC